MSKKSRKAKQKILALLEQNAITCPICNNKCYLKKKKVICNHCGSWVEPYQVLDYIKNGGF